MVKIRVLIADAQPLIRQGVQTSLGLYDGIDIVGEASNGKDTLQKAEALRPDIVIMDPTMPGTTGIDTIRELMSRGIQARILILTNYIQKELVCEAIKLGVTGYLLKDIGTTELAKAVKAVNQGEPQLHPKVTKMLMQRIYDDSQSGTALVAQLTKREREVLTLVAEGLTNKEIALKLHISIKTVKSHVCSIIQKLDVSSRTQAALVAFKEHMVN